MKVAFVPVWNQNPYHGELKEALGSLGIQVLCPDSLKTLHAKWVSGRERLDLLHLHALPYLELSPVGVARYCLFFRRVRQFRKGGVRVMWTVHDFQNHDSRCWRIEDFAARRFSRELDAMIVHGETARRIVITNWGTETCGRIEVIPHGNYIGSYKNEVSRAVARASLGLDESSLVFLFLGLIRPYKGVVEMVKAFRACENPDLRLIIAGRPVSEAIRAEVENSIQGDRRIKFVPGNVENDKVQVFMNASDVVVLPYLRVFTSGAAILAMSFGKPCIAPRAGCVTDSLDEKGAVFFAPEVNGDLERAFRDAVARRQVLTKMGRHNLNRARAWDWQTVGRQTAAVYAQCLDGYEKSPDERCVTGR